MNLAALAGVIGESIEGEVFHPVANICTAPPRQHNFIMIRVVGDVPHDGSSKVVHSGDVLDVWVFPACFA
jgi:hypothetical protein